MKRNLLFFLSLFCGAFSLHAQSFFRDTSVHVYNGTQLLQNAWAGGHNCTNVSDIDLNFDGIKDLVVFNSIGNTYFDYVTCYLNMGTPNQVSYVHAPQYERKFPYLHNWALLIDYNCDGLEDIFTYNVGGFSVYKNTSSNGNLQFTLVVLSVKAVYQNPNNILQVLYTSPADMPAFEDVNHDGDIDVVAFDVLGTKLYYFENLSMERYGTCDSLDFYEYSDCWGHFNESSSTNQVFLFQCAADTPAMHPPDQRMYEQTAGTEETQLHSGNCIMCLDMDSDADMDAMTGSISYCNIIELHNWKDSSLAEMDAYDANYPSSDVPVDVVSYACPYHVDVNNDGKRDLIVSPNSPNASVNRQSLHWYKNTGTDLNPIFTFQQNNFLQDNEIDVGEGSNPAFFDLDGDGLTDLLIGNNRLFTNANSCLLNTTTSLFAYRNIGTATAPKFQLLDTNYANLSALIPNELNFMPTFGDLDSDGDQDMIVGDNNGYLHYFMNTAGPSNPAAFTLVLPFRMRDDNGDSIDVGQAAAPQLFDMDQDGLLDLVIGERSGKIWYYQNTGTTSAPVFTKISTFFGNIDVQPSCCTGYAAPFIFMDSGTIEIFVGTENGHIRHYTNISGNLAGAFTLSDSLLWQTNEVWEGMRAVPTCKDVNNDGLLDMVVGNYRGGAAFYTGTLSTGTHTTFAPFASVSIYPNPSTGEFTIRLDGVSGNAEIKLYSMLGSELITLHSDGKDLVQVSAKDLPPGTYFCKINAVNCTAVKKLLITN